MIADLAKKSAALEAAAKTAITDSLSRISKLFLRIVRQVYATYIEFKQFRL